MIILISVALSTREFPFGRDYYMFGKFTCLKFAMVQHKLKTFKHYISAIFFCVLLCLIIWVKDETIDHKMTYLPLLYEFSFIQEKKPVLWTRDIWNRKSIFMKEKKYKSFLWPFGNQWNKVKEMWTFIQISLRIISIHFHTFQL